MRADMPIMTKRCGTTLCHYRTAGWQAMMTGTRLMSCTIQRRPSTEPLTEVGHCHSDLHACNTESQCASEVVVITWDAEPSMSSEYGPKLSLE